MSKLVIEVSDSLQSKAKNLAAQDGISLEQFVEQAIAACVDAVEKRAHFAERAQRGNRGDFDAVLAKVADNTPDPGDDL